MNKRAQAATAAKGFNDLSYTKPGHPQEYPQLTLFEAPQLNLFTPQAPAPRPAPAYAITGAHKDTGVRTYIPTNPLTEAAADTFLEKAQLTTFMDLRKVTKSKAPQERCSTGKYKMFEVQKQEQILHFIADRPEYDTDVKASEVLANYYKLYPCYVKTSEKDRGYQQDQAQHVHYIQYNMWGQVIGSLLLTFDWEKQELIITENTDQVRTRTWKVEHDNNREYTYRFLKTKLVCCSGIKGFYEHIADSINIDCCWHNHMFHVLENALAK